MAHEGAGHKPKHSPSCVEPQGPGQVRALESAVSGSWDQTGRVWKLVPGQWRATLEGHTGAVGSVAVTADGRGAVSGSRDTTGRRWDLAMITGRLCRQLCVGGREEAVVPGCGGMTQRGRRIVRPQCGPRLRPHDHLSFLIICMSSIPTRVSWAVLSRKG